MSEVKIPEGNQAVMPYLMLHGAEKFMAFAQEVFGASVSRDIHRQPDGSIMHAEIMINGSTIMCCDAKAPWQPSPANLFVYVKSADETYEKALAAGATSLMGLSDQNYGRTCGITDPFGNTWWVTNVITP